MVRFYALERAANRLLASRAAAVPVVVVGNITVGGAGKIAVTLWLARQLQQRGWRPGIVSRGYVVVDDVRVCWRDSRADEVGDEPLLLARRSGCPVWLARVGPRPVLPCWRSIPKSISPVGTMVCNTMRWGAMSNWRCLTPAAGNGRRFPAARPLREPLSRLATVDAVACTAWLRRIGQPSPRL